MISMRSRRCLLRAVVAAWALAAAPAVFAADVKLKTAWMRPAAAGMPEAQVYVDITSDSDLVLVGATTTAAKKVELVDVTAKGDQFEAKVVESMPVPGGKTTRLAYRGSHLRLVDITRDLGNGTLVPVTLDFKSPDGKLTTAKFEAQVRGMLRPQQMPAVVTNDAEPAPKATAPAASK